MLEDRIDGGVGLGCEVVVRLGRIGCLGWVGLGRVGCGGV